VREKASAKRYYVSGIVQGVGYRYFAQGVAERLEIAGYTRNLRDDRVEVYAIGSETSMRRCVWNSNEGRWELPSRA
jgi:acylphosphatase